MKIASIWLIVAFILAAATLYYSLRGLLVVIRWYGVPVSPKSKRIALVLTLVISSLLALQSIGQLSGRDIIVLMPLVCVAYLYRNYGSSLTARD